MFMHYTKNWDGLLEIRNKRTGRNADGAKKSALLHRSKIVYLGP